MDAECGHVNQAVAVERHRSGRAERHAEQAWVLLSQLAQRTFRIALARQRRRYVLGKDRNRDARDQCRRVLGHAIEVARDRDAACGRDPRGSDCGLFVDVVHVQTRAVNTDGSIPPSRDVEAGVPMPEHRALPGRFVHEDDGEPRRRVADHDVDEVHAAPVELAPNAPAVVVVAERAEVSGAQSQAVHAASMLAICPPAASNADEMRSLEAVPRASGAAGSRLT